MAKLNRTNMAATHYQAFRGGNKKLSKRTKALLRGTCCNNDVEVVIDRLPARMRFDNGLAHENPNGANQKWIFQNDPDKIEIAKHLNDYGADATVGIIAPPSYALVTHLAISVGFLPEGFSFQIGSRFGTLDDKGGTLHKVTTSGSVCNPTRDYEYQDLSSLADLTIQPLEKDVLRQDFIVQFAEPVFFAQADEINIKVINKETGSKINPAELDITVAVNYDFVIRSEF